MICIQLPNTNSTYVWGKPNMYVEIASSNVFTIVSTPALICLQIYVNALPRIHVKWAESIVPDAESYKTTCLYYFIDSEAFTAMQLNSHWLELTVEFVRLIPIHFDNKRTENGKIIPRKVIHEHRSPHPHRRFFSNLGSSSAKSGHTLGRKENSSKHTYYLCGWFANSHVFLEPPTWQTHKQGGLLKRFHTNLSNKIWLGTALGRPLQRFGVPTKIPWRSVRWFRKCFIELIQTKFITNLGKTNEDEHKF